MQVTIHEVKTKSALRRFIQYPNKLYKNNPYYVPPLRSSEYSILHKTKSPAASHCQWSLILAYDHNGKIVGRACVLINDLESKKLGEIHARFDWIDFENKLSITRALFQYMEDWSLSRNAVLLKGPYGFSNFDKAGLLIDGYETIPGMNAIYNFPYYVDHFEALGYLKLANWIEYRIKVEPIAERMQQLSSRIMERYELSYDIPKSKKQIKDIGVDVFDLIQRSYADLKGFIPFTDDQAAYYLRLFGKLLVPEYTAFIRDKTGKLIGFGIGVPSYSQALQKNNGQLYPFGWIPILKARKHPEVINLLLIGTDPEWQKKGIPSLIFERIHSNVLKAGIPYAECNPQYEDNTAVRTLFEKYDSQIIRRRRAYQKALYRDL